MTEKEAIEVLTAEKQCLERASKGACKIDCGECKHSVMITKQIDALDVAIKTLEEIQQYRAIGTVEECRAAREKQKPKKLIITKGNCVSKCKNGNEQYEAIYSCPTCKSTQVKNGYPCKCGQKLNWGEKDRNEKQEISQRPCV